jgi:hypothetical protein
MLLREKKFQLQLVFRVMLLKKSLKFEFASSTFISWMFSNLKAELKRKSVQLKVSDT